MKDVNAPAGGYLERQMLIAMPGMVDENFAGSVTLMCQHSDCYLVLIRARPGFEGRHCIEQSVRSGGGLFVAIQRKIQHVGMHVGCPQRDLILPQVLKLSLCRCHGCQVCGPYRFIQGIDTLLAACKVAPGGSQ